MLFKRDLADHVTPARSRVRATPLSVPYAGDAVSKGKPSGKNGEMGTKQNKASGAAQASGSGARPKARSHNQSQSQVQVIARAAAILRALEDEAAGLSLGQIAQRVDLARSTVQRIVAALEAEKFLIAASPNGRVRLGPTILRLADSASTDFVAVARPYLMQLSAELKETVDLSVVKNDHLVFIDQVVGSQRLRTVSAVGETFPLHCTANGKAFLAGLDDAAIGRLIGTNYEARTPRTLTRIADLLRDLKMVRKTGVAVDREEHSLGVCAAGVVTRDPAGNAVAISVPVPAQRFFKHQKQIVERLKATKEALERQLLSAAA
jgi:DNA-binding IclR family transcriptional regulator